MNSTAISFIVFITVMFGINCTELNIDPDMFRNVSGLITSKGYPVKEYTMETSDGFLLSAHRIPHGRNGYHCDDCGHRPAVLLFHGFLDTSNCWVLNFQNQSLGFILADAGYDVWLGNSRGSAYSRHHAKYTPEMKEFWNFSFDEMALFDMPAMIDYILKATGEEKLYYIGYSEGTTTAFALLSESPKYNNKIKLFIALAPVAYLGHMSSPIRYLAPLAENGLLFKILGENELLPNGTFSTVMKEIMCISGARFLCKGVVFASVGGDEIELNKTRLGVYAAHYPTGSSIKDLVHYFQLINSHLFCKYDYGVVKNMEIYKQATPPEYNVSLITAPVALIWAKNDYLSDPVDVEILQQKLRNLVFSHCVTHELFNHIDYLVALDAKTLVYDNILKLLLQYRGNVESQKRA